MGKFKDLTGQKFGKLTVIERVDDYISPKGHHEPQWLCECDCQQRNRITARRSSLTSGNTQSCGCTNKERLIAQNQANHKTNNYEKDLLDEYGLYGIGYCTNTNNKFYFDMDDFDKIKDYCWSERVDKNGYHIVHAWDSEKKKVIKMVHLIAGKNNDHIDRNPLNNRKYNLRKASFAENARNKSLQKNNKSGVSGVYYDSINAGWAAQITVNNKQIKLGLFCTKQDAIIERLSAEVKYFKEFAPQKHLFDEYNILY